MTRKVALITGSAKRIGKAIALKLASEGWDIALHYNKSQKEAEQTLRNLKEFGVNCCLIKADLSNQKQTINLITKAKKQLGPITCLINNAAVFKIDTIENFTSTSWNENMAINLFAPTLLIREFVKQLPHDKSGNVVNMLDYAVLRYPEKFLSYTASKAALWALTQQLALALAKKKVRVNAIGPGRILRSQYDTPASFKKAIESTPLGIDSSLDEICNAVTFIIASSSMTGQMIALDGGKHLVGPDAY